MTKEIQVQRLNDQVHQLESTEENLKDKKRELKSSIGLDFILCLHVIFKIINGNSKWLIGR